MIYVGIDIAKTKHVACVINSNGEILHQPFDVFNSRKGFEYLISKIKDYPKNELLFGLEATGHYAENIIFFLHNYGYKIGRINPIQTNAIRKSNIRKTKNDKVDSILIVKSLTLGDYSPISENDFNLIELKSLCRFRFKLVHNQSDLKKKLVSCIDQIFPEYPSLFKSGIHGSASYLLLSKYPSPQAILKANKNTLTNLLTKNSRGHFGLTKVLSLKQLAKDSIGINNTSISIQIKYLIEQINLLQTQIDNLNIKINNLMKSINSVITTVPGIGNTLGSIIISEIGDIKRFSSPEKVLAFAGLDPSIYQSGNYNATNNRLSKRGSYILRWAIWKSAFLVSTYNPTFQNYYNLKRSQGKSHNTSLGHVCNKIVRVLYKILSEKIEFKL